MWGVKFVKKTVSFKEETLSTLPLTSKDYSVVNKKESGMINETCAKAAQDRCIEATMHCLFYLQPLVGNVFVMEKLSHEGTYTYAPAIIEKLNDICKVTVFETLGDNFHFFFDLKNRFKKNTKDISDMECTQNTLGMISSLTFSANVENKKIVTFYYSLLVGNTFDTWVASK